jgi:predicted flavoprotein YhiN
LIFNTLKEYAETRVNDNSSEDAMESIHAITNELVRRYAPLDVTRREMQTVRALAGRKRTSVATEAMKAQECKPPRKRSRRQCVSSEGGVVTNEIADYNYDVAVANAVAFFQQIKTDDAEPQYTFLGPDTVVINCQK